MSVPPVTVGLPVYNGARYLTEALESILAQTLGDFRVVISDNASTDETEEICRNYVKQDARIEFIQNDSNRGASWNFNFVFSRCQSAFFRWASADDLLAPTCLERCLDVMNTAPRDVALCYTKAFIVDQDGATVRKHEDGLDLRSSHPHVRLHDLVANIVLGNAVFGLHRSDTLRATRGHGSFPSADYVLLAELALAGQIWEIPERLFFRRLHDGTSRAANPTIEDLSLWLDPSSTPVHNEPSRLRREFLAAIRRASISPVERAVCYAFFGMAWARRSSWPARKARTLRTAITGLSGS